MKCITCTERTGDYTADKKTCGSCREVLKIDLVQMILGEARIYLSENNRNKKGRKRKLTATQKHDIYWEHVRDGVSIRSLVRKYKVSIGTISRTIHSYNGPF